MVYIEIIHFIVLIEKRSENSFKM
ncbi:hypothetical protein EZS27_028234, partial [termite gut metagenome]